MIITAEQVRALALDGEIETGHNPFGLGAHTVKLKLVSANADGERLFYLMWAGIMLAEVVCEEKRGLLRWV